MTSVPKDEEEPVHKQKAPVTVAGGWQGLDVVNHGVDDSNENEASEISNENEATASNNKSTRCRWLKKLAERYPRSSHILWKVLVPLFVIIMICFLCGFFLVQLESEGEKEANDAALKDISRRVVKIRQIRETARNAPIICLDAYQGDLGNRTALEEHMKQCGKRLPDSVENTLETLEAEELVYESVTFDWIVCTENTDQTAQAKAVGDAWTAQVDALVQEYRDQGMNETEALELAIDQASSGEPCRLNVAAGALFWLTIATTIGYGNTVPATRGGRALIYTLGFMSVLIFTALIGKAGYICLTIADDFFLRFRRLKPLSKGVMACVFWFAILCLWLLVLSGVGLAFARNRSPETLDQPSLNNAFWFSFISISTIGFGDLHIPHSSFLPRDMFCKLYSYFCVCTFALRDCRIPPPCFFRRLSSLPACGIYLSCKLST